MVKLMDFITVPQARASILWLLGEYSDRVPKIAPDVLRKMAKNFINEQDIVKLQTLNLAVKLYLNNPLQTKQFCQYVFQLAKYDQNYDIRDRARFLRHFIFSEESENKKRLSEFAKRIFLAPKPAPTLTSRFKNSEYQLSTLSHYLNMPCAGYRSLPPFPEIAPDPSVRNVEPTHVQDSREQYKYTRKERKEKKQKEKEKSFYSDDESTAEEDNEDESSDTSESESSEDGSESSEYSSETDKSESNEKNKNMKESEESDSTTDSQEDSDSEEDSDSRESDEGEELEVLKSEEKEKPKSNLDLLLDLDDVVPMTPIMTPSLGGFLTPINPIITDGIREVSTSFIPIKKYEMLNSITGHGLKVEYRFTRSQHLVSPHLVSIELTFTNEGNKKIKDIQIGNKNLQKGMQIHDFVRISVLDINSILSSTLGVNFNDSTQPANFNIDFTIDEEKYSCPVTIKAPIGEIIRSVLLPESMFNSEKAKLKGMNENTARVTFSGSRKYLSEKIFEAANVAMISSENEVMRYAAHTLASKSLVLLTVTVIDNEHLEVCVNCEKMVIGSILLNEFKSNLK